MTRGTPVPGSRRTGRSASTPPTRPHTPVTASAQHGDKKEKPFGSADPILPYSIAGAVFGLGLLALLTVGSQAMEISTLLAFAAIVLWFMIGVGLILVRPVMIGIGTAPKKFLRMVTVILMGIAYFIASGFLMANFSLPI